MEMIVEGLSSIRVGGKYPFLVLQHLCSEGEVVWNFVILVVDSNTGGPSLVAVRMEHLFAYQFDIENIGWKTCEVEKGSIILWIFSCMGAFNVGWWELVWLVLYTSLQLQLPCTYSLPILHIYSTPNRRRIWNPVEHLQLSFCAEIVDVLRPLAIFAEELHRVSLLRCLTGF